MLPDATLICSIFDRWQLLIDVIILGVLTLIHCLAWQAPTEDTNQTETQSGIRTAATAGLTVAGILIPLSILTISLTADETPKLPDPVLTDFFVANVWLVLSLLCGLYVLYYAGFNGYVKNILTSRALSTVFGVQLFLLAVGSIRLVWGMAELVNELM